MPRSRGAGSGAGPRTGAGAGTRVPWVRRPRGATAPPVRSARRSTPSTTASAAASCGRPSVPQVVELVVELGGPLLLADQQDAPGHRALPGGIGIGGDPEQAGSAHHGVLALAEVGGELLGRLRQLLRVLAPDGVHRLGGVPEPLGVLAHLVQLVVVVLGRLESGHPALEPTPVPAHPGRQDLRGRLLCPLGPRRVRHESVEGIEELEVAIRREGLLDLRPARPGPLAERRVEAAPDRADHGVVRLGVDHRPQPVADDRRVTGIGQRPPEPLDLVADRVGHVTVDERPVRRQRRPHADGRRPGPGAPPRRVGGASGSRGASARRPAGSAGDAAPGRPAGPSRPRAAAPARARSPRTCRILRCTALGRTSAASIILSADSSSSGSPSTSSSSHSRQATGPALPSGVPVTSSSANSARTVPSAASRSRRVRRVRIVATSRNGARRAQATMSRRSCAGGWCRARLSGTRISSRPSLGRDLEVPSLVLAAGPAAQRDAGAGQGEVGGVEVDGVQLVDVLRAEPGDPGQRRQVRQLRVGAGCVGALDLALLGHGQVLPCPGERAASLSPRDARPGSRRRGRRAPACRRTSRSPGG